jgi:hypothetical protein
MSSEKTREGRLRRIASRNGNIFRKLRRPSVEGGQYVQYMMVNERNHAIDYWSTLDEAEADTANAEGMVR